MDTARYRRRLESRPILSQVIGMPGYYTNLRTDGIGKKSRQLPGCTSAKWTLRDHASGNHAGNQRLEYARSNIGAYITALNSPSDDLTQREVELMNPALEGLLEQRVGRSGSHQSSHKGQSSGLAIVRHPRLEYELDLTPEATEIRNIKRMESPTSGLDHEFLLGSPEAVDGGLTNSCERGDPLGRKVGVPVLSEESERRLQDA